MKSTDYPTPSRYQLCPLLKPPPQTNTGNVHAAHRVGLCALLPLLFAFLCSCGPWQSEETEAAELIEAYLKLEARRAVRIGEVHFVRSQSTDGKQMPLDVLPLYEVLQELNLIVINSNIDLTSNRSFSWHHFYQLTQQGVVRIMKVSVPDPMNKMLRCPDSFANEDWICWSSGSGWVEDVVRSQRFQLGTKQLWLIMANHRWEWSDIALKFLERKGEDTGQERKLIAIAMYDAFNKKWRLDMVDYASRSGYFKNQKKFDDLLKSAGMAGRLE